MKRKWEKENREKKKGKTTKKEKRKNNEKIADQVGANGPAHTARGGVRRCAKRRPDWSIGITVVTGAATD
jgi:hypothetical protein